MSRQFAEKMEMHRKQQLVAKEKSARGALSFDSPPQAKSRQSTSPFTLPRSAADIIGATQAELDFERDSLALQSSRTAARIRLHEKYVEVPTLYKDECSPEEIKEHICEIAFNAMVKSAIYEELNPADRPYGGFKKEIVLPAHNLIPLKNCDLSHVFVCVLHFVPFDRSSQKAVVRFVRNEREKIMAARIPGIVLDGTEGSMNRLADSICLIKLIARHNDPADDFHMDEHQAVQVSHQFKDGVTFMVLSTLHLLNNMACWDHCKFATQGHFDGTFNWCNRDFALIAFGMISMGAHYNPVSISIVNSDSKSSLERSYDTTYAMY
jgi:hypothetical protein